MKLILRTIFILGVVLSSFSSFCMADSLPPAPTKNIYVYDSEGVLSDSTKTTLLKELGDLDKSGAGQLVVVTTHDYGDYGSIEEFSNELFNKWGIGHKVKDNGVLLVVSANKHKARIEVGRGVEGDLPDIAAGHIIRDKGIPYFKKNDFDTGVLNMVSEIKSKLENGETVAMPATTTDTVSSDNKGGFVFYDKIPEAMLLLFIVAVLLWASDFIHFPRRKKKKREVHMSQSQIIDNEIENIKAKNGVQEPHGLSKYSFFVPAGGATTMSFTSNSSNDAKKRREEEEKKKKKRSSDWGSSSSYGGSSSDYGSSSSGGSDFGGGGSDGGGSTGDW